MIARVLFILVFILIMNAMFFFFMQDVYKGIKESNPYKYFYVAALIIALIISSVANVLCFSYIGKIVNESKEVALNHAFLFMGGTITIKRSSKSITLKHMKTLLTLLMLFVMSIQCLSQTSQFEAVQKEFNNRLHSYKKPIVNTVSPVNENDAGIICQPDAFWDRLEAAKATPTSRLWSDVFMPEKSITSGIGKPVIPKEGAPMPKGMKVEGFKSTPYVSPIKHYSISVGSEYNRTSTTYNISVW